MNNMLDVFVKTLYRSDQWLTCSRTDQIGFDTHQLRAFRLGLVGLWQMQIHLIAVKVCIVWSAGAFIKSDEYLFFPNIMFFVLQPERPIGHHFDSMGHNADFVQ
jgi:hypothetical protein